MGEYSLFVALKKKLEGDIEVHKTNIDIYMNNTVGIGEHIDIVETVEKELEKLSAAEDKLMSLKGNFQTEWEHFFVGVSITPWYWQKVFLNKSVAPCWPDNTFVVIL